MNNTRSTPRPVGARRAALAGVWSWLGLCLGVLAAERVNAATFTPPPSPRQELNLDADWRFLKADVAGAQASDFDDSGWSAVTLPHTWNSQDGQDGGDNYYRGPGWYRRHLLVPGNLVGRKLYLQFDGANRLTEVFVNGRSVGRHLGGFARFRFDVTDTLKPDADNVISVRVDNGTNDSAPMHADFTFFGGLYRDVTLLATDPVQITATDYASPGVYLEQTRVTPESAEVTVRAKLANAETGAEAVTVRTTIVEPNGQVVVQDEAQLQVAAHNGTELSRPVTIARPHLWNGRAAPYVYRAYVEVLTAGKLRDLITQPLGLRFFHIDPQQGFLLNGRQYPLHGVSRHQDRVDKGWAISAADEREDFALIRELGATAIRVAHYQQSQRWYTMADEAGIVMWAEVPLVGPVLNTDAFAANVKDQMRELIRQNYNHPAIVVWGCGNETKGEVGIADGVIQLLSKLVHEEDPTRPSTYASNHPENDPRSWRTDAVAFNIYRGWYGGKIEQFGSAMDALHRDHPTTPIGVSEYGAGASIRQHQENPTHVEYKGPLHPEEYQAIVHEGHWRQIQARPYLWATFVWNMFDFAADQRSEGDTPGRNDKGLVTYDRKTKKDAFFWYKANWSDEPVLYITSRRFTPRTSAATEVKVYSNARTVALIVNGVSLGEKTSEDRIFRWPSVTLRPGDNLIEANAAINGTPQVDRCSWSLERARPLTGLPPQSGIKTPRQ